MKGREEVGWFVGPSLPRMSQTNLNSGGIIFENVKKEKDDKKCAKDFT